MNEKNIRKTEEFKTLRAEAREAIEAYAGGAGFEATVSRLAGVGRVMAIMLG